MTLQTNENDLQKVAGGSQRREKTITIPLRLPMEELDNCKLDVYIDGVLEPSYTRIVDTVVEVVNLRFVGSVGLMKVNIKLNNALYKEYIIDFDNMSYQEY